MNPVVTPMRRPWRLALALVGLLVASTLGVAPAAAAPGDQLPDLKMGDIYNIRLAQAPRGGRLRLQFGTIVWNVGDGPLQVEGSNRQGDVMRELVQRIQVRGGGSRTYVPPGAEAFYSGDGHNHWHINAFITISLFSRNAAAPVDPTLVTDRGLRKIGFCLTDLVRAPASLRPANAASRIGFPVVGCGTSASQDFRMGISPGWGDDYKPFFNHQWIDIVGLETGTYRMCATVNGSGMWQEKNQNLANNSAWLDLEIDSEGSSLSVVASGDSDCEKPPPIWFGVGA